MKHRPPTTAEAEGVIKFELVFRRAEPPSHPCWPQLEGWRQILRHLELVGQAEDRYQGLAYGNVSMRTGNGGFLISGTQTSGAARLAPTDYCQVESWDLRSNRIHAAGLVRPSSEALSHAALYQARPEIGSVVHVHCPELWRKLIDGSLPLPATPADVPYGTPALALSLLDLVLNGHGPVLGLAGHEDGLIAFGAAPATAASALLGLYAGVIARHDGT